LIEVDKQPLLSKTINQLKERGYDPVIITKNEELKIDKSFEPEDNRYTVSSLLSTRPLREGRNVILLGDVNYSEQALDKIFDFKEDIKVFGSK
jgi:choline kinase